MASTAGSQTSAQAKGDGRSSRPPPERLAHQASLPGLFQGIPTHANKSPELQGSLTRRTLTG